MEELSREDHERLSMAAAAADPPDYNLFAVHKCAASFPVFARKVLVVGCNRGGDCKSFIDIGAAQVVGLDVTQEIGKAFSHERVQYELASAEDMPFPDDMFDVVFCFATMEHVPDIRRAFAEMARVCRPGGGIFAISGPLWNARSGPHWGASYYDYPWIHLRMNEDEIIAFTERRKLEQPDSPYASPDQIRYFMHDLYFNKRPAREYLEICAGLQGMEVIQNYIDQEDASGVDPAVIAMMEEKGFDRQELFGLMHNYVGRKVAPAGAPG